MLNTRLIASVWLSLLAATSTAFALEWEDQIIGDTMPGWEIKNVSEPVWMMANGVLTCTGGQLVKATSLGYPRHNMAATHSPRD